MAAKIGLHAGPSAGFDQPLEMLLACHERIERMLSLLDRIAGRLKESGPSESQQIAMRIEQEHLVMTTQWQQVRKNLVALREAVATAFHEFVMPDDYAQRWHGFARFYRAHIGFEESMIFARVSSQLEASAIW